MFCFSKILSINLSDSKVITGHLKGIMSLAVCRDYFALASEDCTCSLYDNPFKYTGK
ncbi:hypothetical protein DPMN_078024 [Dreissena polymorpha]|uniref:Uncharacterized protein n=1 Tax=Dreissena polymorpha TaxID=45954 RepID=A0A9D3YN22_DREPO|nr:hypothetical protein DPMN_078024 [Dreissena polymorpha]